MIRLLFSILFLILTGVTGSAVAKPSSAAKNLPTAEDLLSGWRNAIYTDREHSKLKLTLLAPGAAAVQRQAEIWYKSSDKNDSKILMKFHSPASIRGVAFLSLRDSSKDGADQWLYLPAYKKARRLSSHSRDESFLDSDFSNGDISFEYENAFNFKMAGEKTLDNQRVYMVEGLVKADKKETLQYGREVLFFTQKDKLNIRTEFYDHKNVLVKVLKVSQWKKYGSRWAADKIEVENMQSGHRSILEFSDRNSTTTPADRLFTLSELERGRR